MPATRERQQLFESVKHDFLSTVDSVALAELTERAPFMLETEFLEYVGEWISTAEQQGAHDQAEGLRERLVVLHEIAAQDAPAWRATLEAFAAARTSEELAALASSNALARDPAFIQVIEDFIDQAERMGDRDDAHALRLRLIDLQQVLANGGAGLTLAELVGRMQQDDPNVATEALALLAGVGSQQELLTLIGQMPIVLEDHFLALVEQAIAQADKANDPMVAGRLRAQLEGLRMVKAQVEITLPQTLEAFASVRDAGELLALVQRAPFVLEERFVLAVERAIDELEGGGGMVEAAGLRVRLNALRQIRNQQEQAEQSSLMQALLNFLNAPDDQGATAIYALQYQELDSDEAVHTLEHGFAGGDPESQQRIEERTALLRHLRTLNE